MYKYTFCALARILFFNSGIFAYEFNETEKELIMKGFGIRNYLNAFFIVSMVSVSAFSAEERVRFVKISNGERTILWVLPGDSSITLASGDAAAVEASFEKRDFEKELWEGTHLIQYDKTAASQSVTKATCAGDDIFELLLADNQLKKLALKMDHVSDFSESDSDKLKEVILKHPSLTGFSFMYFSQLFRRMGAIDFKHVFVAVIEGVKRNNVLKAFEIVLPNGSHVSPFFHFAFLGLLESESIENLAIRCEPFGGNAPGIMCFPLGVKLRNRPNNVLRSIEFNSMEYLCR